MHFGCENTSIYCDAPGGANDEDLMRMLVVSEAAEVFMDNLGGGWDCGASNGEGLSRVLATDAYPQVPESTARSWLDSPRPDYVDFTEGSDTNHKSIGCATLFLNYLRFQLGFSWRQIVRTPGQHLADAFYLLTGRTDAFDSFSSLVARRFPVGVNADLPTTTLSRSGPICCSTTRQVASGSSTPVTYPVTSPS